MTLPPAGPLEAPARILTVKLADVGDLLLITPALRALRQRYPAARLDILTTPRSMPALENLKHVDNVLAFDKYHYDRPGQAVGNVRLWELASLAGRLRATHYDMVILFHHLSLRFGAVKHALLVLASGAAYRLGLDNGRGWFLTHHVTDLGFGVRHEVDYFLELAAAAGAPSDSRKVEIGLSDADRAAAAALVPPSHEPTIALHPGSGGYSPSRRWETAKFVQLGERLRQQQDARVVVVGKRADGTEDVVAGLGDGVVDLGDRTTLAQLAAVLEQCDLLIGADSGVLHVASAVGTSTVALFGPTNHRAWAPVLPPERLTIVRSDIVCSPCAYTEQGLGTPAGCSARTCMALLSVERVHRAAVAALSHGIEADARA